MCVWLWDLGGCEGSCALAVAPCEMSVVWKKLSDRSRFRRGFVRYMSSKALNRDE